jgi:hypothetical protein
VAASADRRTARFTVEGFVVLAILVIILVILGRALLSPGGWDLFRRARRLGPQREAPTPRQPTVEDLLPGDAISFWDGADEVVEWMIRCREELGGRVAEWKWVLLTGDRMLEIAPDERVLYQRVTVLYQGSEPFYRLTAEPEQDGALKTFEARIRDGTIARDPVSTNIGETSWTVESTGTFLATTFPGSVQREVWRDISADASDNVYFELRGEGEARALGIWTSHILLLEGRPLEETDIQSLYPGGGKEQRE